MISASTAMIMFGKTYKLVYQLVVGVELPWLSDTIVSCSSLRPTQRDKHVPVPYGSNHSVF